MEIKANAKINWYLDVEGTLPNGYHLIKSIMQPISLTDTVIVEQAAADSLTCTDKLLENNKNLAYRAWLLMKERCRIKGGLRIHIVKNIPVTAGLGGGSADAAAVLRGVNSLFGLDLPLKTLMSFGAELGTDIPFAVQNIAAISTGIGTELHSLGNMPSYDLLLINPNIGLATKQVYENYRRLRMRQDELSMVEALRSRDMDKIGELLYNALTPSAAELCSRIADMYNDIKSCGLYASMTGSGATVFGVGDKIKIDAAYSRLKNKYPVVIKAKTL